MTDDQRTQLMNDIFPPPSPRTRDGFRRRASWFATTTIAFRNLPRTKTATPQDRESLRSTANFNPPIQTV